jgi:hypothetical protein
VNAATRPSPVWLNKKTVLRLDRCAQHLVVRNQGRPHRIGVCLPPTSRTLNIGEHKRDDPRGRTNRGHPHRMSQATHSHVEHRGVGTAFDPLPPMMYGRDSHSLLPEVLHGVRPLPVTTATPHTAAAEVRALLT